MDMPDISGVWRLRGFFFESVETSERSDPFGPTPSGTLIMHPGGRMAAVITPAERPAPASEADQVAAFQNLIAYSGVWRLEPPNRFVTSIDVAWFQPWVGTEQARSFTFGGDTLEIVSAPTRTPRTGEALVVGILAWVRDGSPVSA